MHVLMLCYRDQPLREFPLTAHPLEVGSGAGADIVVHDPDTEERHYLVRRRGGAVYLEDLLRREVRPLSLNSPTPVGRFHTLVRMPDTPTRQTALPRTDELPSTPCHGEVALVVGRGSEARRRTLGARTVTVGSAEGCDLRIDDRAVSSRHCRIEPVEEGVCVRDLGSRNGTFVDGVRVHAARVRPGSAIRVGQTDVFVVERGRSQAREEVSCFVAEAAVTQALLERVRRCAVLSRHTLVVGESGVGKEWIAQALHRQGRRAQGPFVAVNAGGMPATLVESELFGHERGAFTGAAVARRGLFEQADGGTLFLDEVGELPIELQARLLRVLETGCVRRLGSESGRRVDVRVVSATHRDLRAMVADGRFREDLYYRITPLEIRVPPLRDRPDDIPALAAHFLALDRRELGGERRLSEEALTALLSYRWPGNVRELRNVVYRAAASHGGEWITRDDIHREIGGLPAQVDESSDEEKALLRLVRAHRYNVTAAARALGVPRSTLRGRLAALERRRQPERSTGT